MPIGTTVREDESERTIAVEDSERTASPSQTPTKSELERKYSISASSQQIDAIMAFKNDDDNENQKNCNNNNNNSSNKKENDKNNPNPNLNPNSSNHPDQSSEDNNMNESSIRHFLGRNHVDDDEDDNDDDLFSLEEDAYSILFVAPMWSRGQFLAIAVMAIQQFILNLILIDLLQDDTRPNNVPDDNRFNVPVTTESQVSIAQVLALLVSVITQQNAFVSVDAIFLADYDPNRSIVSESRQSSASARPTTSRRPDTTTTMHPAYRGTFWMWKLVNFLRWCTGVFALWVSFTIVVQSDTVLDIFMNFAAVQFVDELDNAAFQLAAGGYLGQSLRKQAVAVRRIHFRRDTHAWRLLATQLAFVSTIVLLLGGWAYIRTEQKQGHYLQAHACNAILASWGDEIYHFDPDGTKAPGITSPLHYAYFGALYYPRFESDERPIYYERTNNDVSNPRLGRFYYCDAEKSWQFTIPALEAFVPEGTKRLCGQGWLMQSPITDAYVLEDVPLQNWKIIAGVGVPQTALGFHIQCGECHREADCSFNGVCTSTDKGNKCDCYDGWQGFECNVPSPLCSHLVQVMYGASAPWYKERGPYYLVENSDNIDDLPTKVYNRPVYMYRPIDYESANSQDALHKNCGFFLLYTGRRWFETHLCPLTKDYHAFWDKSPQALLYSDPTTAEVPIGFGWNEILDTLSQGTYGSFGAHRPVQVRYECSNVTCGTRTCGRYGQCVPTPQGNQCACENYAGGYFCEHSIQSDYSNDHYTAIRDVVEANPTMALDEMEVEMDKHHLFSDYYRKYWRPILANELNETVEPVDLVHIEED